MGLYVCAVLKNRQKHKVEILVIRIYFAFILFKHIQTLLLYNSYNEQQ